MVAGRLTRNITALGDDSTARPAYDPDRTAVIPTAREVPDQVPPGGYLDPTPGSYAEPDPGYSAPGATYPGGGAPNTWADPVGGTGQPLPPPERTDPLPGVPSTGAPRP
nr:hypothetical protein [Micromonospora provocatoris]